MIADTSLRTRRELESRGPSSAAVSGAVVFWLYLGTARDISVITIYQKHHSVAVAT